MTVASIYPVRVDAHLDPHLSRWLWLVKWVLSIPHYIVLAFLWIAFAVTSVIAFFAILFTARYPQPIFEFNVGVLRWGWRVSYYAYSALGTDRYPPFSLAEVPDYPAQLHVPYPEHLSRGLVLVKWWLLALPHLLIVGVLVGGGAWFAVNSDTDNYSWTGGGLIGLLVFIAAIVLAVTGAYPRGLFDFNVGVMRWSWRVNYYAYSALGTDLYPPFKLAEVPDYPAHLHVPYPQHLSRGLVLVKWWLLALPHLLIVGILAGGGAWFAMNSDTDQYSWTGGGLIGLLVLIAAIVLAVTGRYPNGLYDLILGLNRWVLRVAAYTSLMTDTYPPFRLDTGGTDPATTVIAPTGEATGA